MRLLHTSDWHLGHTLHDLPRDHEHQKFLDWLVETVAAERVDALLITGDIFDGANPPAAAQSQWYGVLAALHRRAPALDVVVIGGNHDSAARLDAPRPLLGGLGVHVVGGLPFTSAGVLDVERLVVPLHDGAGRVAAWAVAVPFLRPSDLPTGATGPTGDPLIEGVRAVYAAALQAARARLQPGQALVALGHCYMTGTSLQHLSERRVLGGNQHALPADIFPDDVTYAALGHLHKAQRVGGHEHIRYAGSPIPLAMGEARYRHQVCVVDLEGASLAGVRSVPVPRSVDLVRVPARGAAPIDEVESLLAALDPLPDVFPAPRPYLEACVSLPAAEPRLRQRIEQALEGRLPRLVKLTVEHTGDRRALGDVAAPALRELDPAEVFLRRWRRDHQGDPPAEVMEAFFELLDRVRQEGAT